MRPNNDLGLVVGRAFSFGAAQAASLLFAAACHERLSVTVPSVPEPLVLFVSLCHACVPWIPCDVQIFFAQITFRPNHPIKRFGLPHRIIGILSLVDPSRRERLYGM